MSASMPMAADRLAQRFQRAAVVAVAVAVPMVVFGRGAMQGVLALAVLLALAATWRGRVPVLDLRECRPLLLAIGAVALAWIPSVAVSIDPLMSFSGWARTILLAVGSMVLWTTLRRDADGYRLALKVLLVATLLAVVPAAIVTSLIDVSHPVARSMKSKASAFAVLLPVLVHAGVTLRRRWLVAAIVAVIGIVALVLGTGSRSGMAGLAVASTVILSLYAIRRRRYWIIALGIVAAVILVSKAKPWDRVYDDEDLGRYELYLPHSLFDTHRQVIWRFTFHKFLEKPVFGWGINVINMSPGAGDLVPGMNQEYIPAHPHSWLVEVSSETGATGFLTLVAALAWGFMRLARAYMRSVGSSALAGLAAMTVFWSSAAFNFSIWAVWWELVLMMSLALAFGQPPRTAPPD